MGLFSGLGDIVKSVGSFVQPFSSLISGGASLLGGMQRNEASAQQAMLANEFSERMANTQHQRAVADLRAAGLNPILSATSGMSNASPSGQQATMTDVLSPAVSTALDAARTSADVSLKRQQERMREPVAIVMDAIKPLIESFKSLIDKLPSQSNSAISDQFTNRPGMSLPDVAGLAISKAYRDVGQPDRMEFYNKSNPDPRKYREGWDWADVANSVKNRITGNSAKSTMPEGSTYQDKSGRVHRGLSTQEFLRRYRADNP